MAEKSAAEKGLNEKIEAIQLAENKRLSDIADTERQADELTKKVAEQHRQLDAKRNEFKLTKSMVESLEGFPESIKFLSQQKEWAKNCPLLSDLLYVREEYRVAIENYLEPYLNYYVVPDADAAVQAIQMLGQGQKGRANFFLLDAFRDYQPPLALLPGGFRAIELVEVEASYRPLLEYLLANVVVSDDPQPPANIPDADTVILGKSGTFTRRKFSMSGGSVGLFEGKKIGRKKNLELLDGEIKKLEGTENQLTTQLATLRTHLQALKNADQSALLQREREVLNRLRQEKAGQQAKRDNIAAFVANFDAQAGDANQRIAALTASNAAIETQLSAKQQAAAAVRDRLANADGSFRDVADHLS
ncbi:MAG TPA: chromosome segregation protein SMC, partial [Saprospiraceae bacterium]|nr:chromosome segregation protein SMC [Saprospiraceae bacterium]